eukprot:NODE_72_length_24857_cov_0.454399.p3 type:complete len:393 gc:universal NODE_72_length_24857_cov_0.454399:5320-4142(-)
MNKVQIMDLRIHSGLQDCKQVFNGVFTQYKGKTLEIVRCYLGKVNHFDTSEIRLIYDNRLYKLNVKDTPEFIKWGQHQESIWFHFYGPEDPRITYFNHEMYLYFTMTNPKQAYPIRGMEMMKMDDILNGSSERHFINLKNFNGKSTTLEKNWLFIYNSTNMLALYSLHPYVLGELKENTLINRIEREYDCLLDIITADDHKLHFSSNAIKINNNGSMEFMFVLNYMRDYPTRQYHPYLAFVQAEKPYELLRISKNELKLNTKHKQFTIYSSITVKDKDDLFANENDILVLSGGIDDDHLFKVESRLEYYLDLPMTTCGRKHNEWAYFGYPKVETTTQSADIDPNKLKMNADESKLLEYTVTIPIWSILFVITLFLGLLIYSRKKKYRYDKLV